MARGNTFFSVELSIKFIMLINTTSENFKARSIFIFQYFSFNEQLKFLAQFN